MSKRRQYDQVNENEEEVEEKPIEIEEQAQVITQQKGNFIINLAVIGFIILIISIIIMMTISKMEEQNKWEKEKFNQPQPNLSFVRHNSSNFSQLYCPNKESFSPIFIECITCPPNCLVCQPGFGHNNPCLRCDNKFHLQGEMCVKDCAKGFKSSNQICYPVNKEFPKLDIINLNDLPVISSFHYLTAQKNKNFKSLVILVPPIGSSFMFYPMRMDIMKIASELNAGIITFETPIERIIKQWKNSEKYTKSRVEDFTFPEFLFEQIILQNFNLSSVDKFYYVGMGDGMLIVQLIAFYFLGNQDFNKFEHTLVLLETNEIKLQTELMMDSIDLGIVLNYIENKVRIKHEDNEQGLSLNDQKQENISGMLELAQKFKQIFNLQLLFLPTKNRLLEVFLLSEQGCDKLIEKELQDNKMKSVTRVEVKYNMFTQQDKLNILFNEGLFDILSGHQSWLIREQRKND